MAPATLCPVVEFDPFEYRVDRAAPKATIEQAPDEWAAFWRASLTDAGLSQLTPLGGTWVVPAADLDDTALHAAVLRHFDVSDLRAIEADLPGPFDPRSGFNADGEPIESFTTPLRGGLALITESASITPECCGDLGNWHNWQNACRVETAEWQSVWIGHPSARACLAGGHLLVQKVNEGEEEPVGVPIPIPAADLQIAVDAARPVLEGLATRLTPILATALGPELGVRLSRHLAGLAEAVLD